MASTSEGRHDQPIELVVGVDEPLRHCEWAVEIGQRGLRELVAHREHSTRGRLVIGALRLVSVGNGKVLYTSSALMRWSLLMRPPMARTQAMNIEDCRMAKSHGEAPSTESVELWAMEPSSTNTIGTTRRVSEL